ncbi:MAG: GAF domain-containing protein [Planctomycetes bacterium]|nr:GAF domain-containing protein [Planctomycetota bacterium]
MPPKEHENLSRTGPNPLPWPPWRGSALNAPSVRFVALAWTGSLVLALVLGQYSVNNSWFNFELFGWRMGIYPPWLIGLLWVLWAGWAYGAVILAVCATFFSLQHDMGAWSFAIGVTDALGAGVFALFLSGFSIDPRLRSLRNAIGFAGSLFFASITGSFGTLFVVLACSASETPMSPREGLATWEGWWLGHLLEGVLLAWPLALLAHHAVHHWKARHLNRAPAGPSFRRQVAATICAGLAVVVFYCVWLVEADVEINESIRNLNDPVLRERLIETQRAENREETFIIISLLGLLGFVVAIALLLRRRYIERLNVEISGWTSEQRRLRLQLLTLQAATEAVAQSLDAQAVVRNVAQRLAHSVEPGVVAVYLRDEVDPEALQRVSTFSQGDKPLPEEGPEHLAAGQSLLHEALTEGASFVAVRGDSGEGDGAIQAKLDARGAQTVIGVPVSGERSVMGVIEIALARHHRPSSDERDLYDIIGRAVGAALERAEVHAVTRRRAGVLGHLYQLSQDVATETDALQLLRRVASEGRRMLGAETMAIGRIVRPPGREPYLEIVAEESTPEGVHPRLGADCPLSAPFLMASCARDTSSLSAGIRPEAPVATPLFPDWIAQTAFVAPIVFGRLPCEGVLATAFPPGRSVGPEETGLAEELARQAAAGLRRIGLLEETRHQATELALFGQIGRALSEPMRTTETLDRLVQNAAKIFPCEFAGVMEHEPGTNQLIMRVTNTPNPEAAGLVIPLDGTSLLATCFKQGQTLVSEDMANDPRCNQTYNRRFDSGSAVAVPLGGARTRFGVLFAMNRAPRPFAPEEVRRLEQVAGLAAVALERARLYEELQTRADELVLLNEIARVLVETPVLETSLQRIADIVRRHFGVAGAGFLLVDPSGKELVGHGVSGELAEKLRGLRVPLHLRGVTTLAFSKQQPVVVEDAYSDERVSPMLREILAIMNSGVAMPMQASAGPVGTLCIFDRQKRRYEPRDLQRLRAVARLAAAAVERGELGQALKASEARLQEILDGVPALVIGVNTEGRVVSMNATAEHRIGWRRDEVLGRDVFDLLLPSAEERESYRTMIREALDRGERLQNVTATIQDREGRRLKVRWSSEPLRGPDGRIQGLVGMGIDVTEQLNLEAQLLQAQKMESVGALAGGLAHDFNNLLGGILGQIALARAQLGADHPLQNILAKMEGAAHRGTDLTGKLLAFARKSVIQPMAVDVGTLLLETAELLGGSLPREIDVRVHVDPGLPRVLGDPTQLQQVLLNLCVNARDAMPNGGFLTLSATAADPHSGRRENGTRDVLIEVSDTGTGMTQEVRDRIFEPFFTTKEKGKGTGLGLSVVFGIVRSHLGVIEVDSEPGTGSRFNIRLPGAEPAEMALASGRSAAMHPPPRSAQPAAASSSLLEAVPFGGSERVLLIDDEEIIRDTSGQLLAALGYKVRTAQDGAESLRVLDREHFLPDVVILDVIMPGLSGPGLLAELRKRLPRAPVLLVSGYSQSAEVQEMLGAGASELIQKPFRLDDLAAAIRRVLEAATNSQRRTSK